MNGLELLSLDAPTEVRTFEKGKFELYRVGPMTLGRATYEPGWRWSTHVGANTGESSCQVEHVGLVLSGQAMAAMEDGTERVMRAGEFFYVPPGHDSWVVGDEPYVSLHIMGSEGYAATQSGSDPERTSNEPVTAVVRGLTPMLGSAGYIVVRYDAAMSDVVALIVGVSGVAVLASAAMLIGAVLSVGRADHRNPVAYRWIAWHDRHSAPRR